MSMKKNFTVDGVRLLDPDGKPFLVKGVNANGPGWVWQRDTLQDADLITDVWKFNTVRLCMALGWTWVGDVNRDLDALVDAFTKKGVVVMLEVHDFTGRYPNNKHYGEGFEGTKKGDKEFKEYCTLSEFADWWADTAKKYKDNPYVWFNIMNEPGSVPSEQTHKSIKEWLETHDRIIGAIRATGAENIVVCDEHVWGQGCGYFRQPTDSAIIVNGAALSTKYDNIVHSLHMYHSWKNGWERLRGYIADARDQGLCVIIGEFGAGRDDAVTQNVAQVMFDECLPASVGRIFWAWDGSDVHQLTYTRHEGVNTGGGWEIDRTDGQKPGNLSWVGSLIWDDNHDALTAPVAMYDAPVVANGGFENGMAVWQNWGGASVSAGTARDGTTCALKIEKGVGGGVCNKMMLMPNTNYTLGAWGKNSASVKRPSEVGAKFKTPAGELKTIKLSFEETDWTYKTVRFTTPDMKLMSDELIYVYKYDPYADFYADDIAINKT